MGNGIITVSELAEHLKISRSKAFEIVHSKEFSMFKIGKRILIRECDLNHWIEEQINENKERIR